MSGRRWGGLGRNLLRKLPLLAAFGCAVLSVWAPPLGHGREGRVRVLLFDNSPSFRRCKDLLGTFLAAYTRDIAPPDRWLLAVFDRYPMTVAEGVSMPSSVPPLPRGLPESRIVESLEEVVERFSPREVVLFSDGNSTGTAPSPVRVPVYPVLPAVAPPYDCRVAYAYAPPSVRQGEKVVVEGDLSADLPMDVTLEVRRGDVLLERMRVRVGPGGYLFSVEDVPPGEGSYVYEVSVSSPIDEFPENDRWLLPVTVGEKKKVVLVTENERSLLKEVFGALGDAAVVVRRPSGLSGVDLQGADAVVWEGYGWGHHDVEAEVSLAFAVKGGLGLLYWVSSGDAFDNLMKSPLREVLPVRFTGGGGRMHVVVALDISGSMGEAAGRGVKMEQAKLAVLHLLKTAAGRVRVDVVAFAREARVVASVRRRGDVPTAVGKVMRLRPAGGTRLLPAVDLSLDLFAGESAPRKILVIVSDGFVAEKNLDRPLMHLKESGVRVFTAGVGDQVDTVLMKRLAEATGGAWIHVRDAVALPERFLEQMRRGLSGEFFSTGRFEVVSGDRARDLLSLKKVPPVTGVAKAVLKRGAFDPLRTKGGEPVVAAWNKGLGRVACVCVPLDDDHAPAWMGWKELGVFLGSLVAWCRRSPGEDVDWRVDGNALRVTYRWGRTVAIPLRLVVGDGKSVHESVMTEVAPGIWEGRVPRGTSRLLNGTVMNGKTPLVSFRMFVPYPPEFSRTAVNEGFLEALAAGSGGKVLRLGEAIPTSRHGSPSDRDSSRRLFAALVLLFLLVDLALRRLAAASGA